MIVQINLNNLTTFLALAERLNFGETARALKVSQPSVSRQIRSLEDDLGKRLFLRDRSSVALTDDGKKLKARLKSSLDLIHASLDDIAGNAASGELKGTLRFGSLAEVGQSTFMSRCLEFQAQNTGVDLRISYEEEDEILKGLRNGLIDFGTLTNPVEFENIACFPLLQESIVLITRAQNKVDPKALKVLPVVVYRPSDALITEFLRRNREFTKGGRAVREAVAVNSHRSMMEALAQNDFFAFMPESSARDWIDSGRFKILPTAKLINSIYLAHVHNPHFEARNIKFKSFMLAQFKKRG